MKYEKREWGKGSRPGVGKLRFLVALSLNQEYSVPDQSLGSQFWWLWGTG
jgi:hypothetical protein